MLRGSQYVSLKETLLQCVGLVGKAALLRPLRRRAPDTVSFVVRPADQSYWCITAKFNRSAIDLCLLLTTCAQVAEQALK